jgi:hypothetical protein
MKTSLVFFLIGTAFAITAGSIVGPNGLAWAFGAEAAIWTLTALFKESNDH